MSIITKSCWHCDLCTHVWVAVNIEQPPQQCPKCRKRNWNTATAPVQSEQPTLHEGSTLIFNIEQKDGTTVPMTFKVGVDDLPSYYGDIYKTRSGGRQYSRIVLEVVQTSPKPITVDDARALQQRMAEHVAGSK